MAGNKKTPKALRPDNKKYFTDRTLKALVPAKPGAKPGARYEVWDTKIPGFGCRVGEDIDPSRPGKAAQITFILYMRFPGSDAPSRSTLGRYGVLTLKQARAKAADWRRQVEEGKDPGTAKTQNVTVSAVIEDFIKEKLPSERRGSEVERDIRRLFIPAWGKRPITDITALDVLAVIKGIKGRGKLAQAHNALGYARRLFNWAVDQHVYGLEASPCDRLKPRSIIGKRG